jgi:transcriptional regulator with XRE-family HTH domain
MPTNKFARLLVKNKLTATALAGLLGMASSSVRALATTNQKPKPDTARKIATALGVRAGDIWKEYDF